MLEDMNAGWDGDCDHGSEYTASAKQQYTVKGIESETIRLMREAAQSDGMKIGAWISSKMREAAARSLEVTNTSGSVHSAGRHLKRDSSNLTRGGQAAESGSDRLAQIEAQLHSITRTQLTMIELLLRSEKKSSD